jgi:voltage-gated potassium channel
VRLYKISCTRTCDVVGIDLDAEKLHLSAGLTVEIHGDGSKEEILKEAGIERARGFAIATPSSATNVYVTLSARQLNPSLHILTRVDEDGAGEKAIRAGADEVINPFGISGARMAQGLIRPHAANFVDLAIGRSFGDFALEDVTLGNAVQFHGRLEDVDVSNKYSVMVIGVRKSTGQLITSIDRNTELAQGDVVVLIGRPGDIGNFALAASGTTSPSTRPHRRFES